MSRINILPKEVYSLIAAGEVVERPMSVVKEMLENAIDAGAKHITLEIKNGGTTYIRITDDGSGIARDDVKKVFISHATSKIATGEDLNAIGTLGFRGEAMASIAAVSKVELLTKTSDEKIGTRYEIAGGEEIGLTDAGCPDGTTVVVRDIFFNVPARMKFLKKDVTEGNAVQGVIDRIALSHPEISFRFIRDGKQALITSGNGDLKGTVYSVFGSELSDTLINVDYSYESMRVSGYVSRPHESRKSRAMQFFFINGRLIKSATAMAALEQAYKNVIMAGRYPACVLNIEIDTKLVDVNVHPSKTEVRFVNEKPVFDLIYYGVKTAIETKNSVKKGSFYSDAGGRVYKNLEKQTAKIDFGVKPQQPSQLRFSNTAPQKKWSVAAPSSYSTHRRAESYGDPKDFKISSGKVFSEQETVQENEYATVVSIDFSKNAKAAEPDDLVLPPENTAVTQEENAVAEFKVVGEAFNTYIIVEIKNDLYYIDKHAAHERMNFERLKQDAQKTGIASQALLSPVAVSLAPEEYDAVISNLALISKCGFSVEDFGSNSVIVRETPAMLDGSDVKDLILEIAQKLLEHKTDIEPEKMDWIFHSTSCRAAVKGGDHTSQREREMFVERLLAMPDIRYCPHGRPVMIKISRYELEKQFGRVQ
ncbi:MAG TPA: DNA mismatch repair endonuclease MutL [Candidatus Eubacterium faecavium]|nr:DNA mismatch repair endonuclease MutL [Candidatus Eubacterium faecavium]